MEDVSVSQIRSADSKTSTAISPLEKGFGALTGPMQTDEIAGLRWSLLREDLSLPIAVLYEERLQHNLGWMQRFVDAYGLKLAPHGKTTMIPKLFERQIAAGAWGITVATAQQTVVAYEHGIRRVLMANQLVGKANMAMIARLLSDVDFEFYCLVDSPEQINQLGLFFSEAEVRLNVLIELGVQGGRAGIRAGDDEREQAVLDALTRWGNSLSLCGIELYEGVLSDEAAVRAFLGRAVEIVRHIDDADHFARSPILLSGAGSAWYDVVAEVFSQAELGDAVEIVLRPGCYLSHDAGLYKVAQSHIQERNPVARRMHSGLLPALQVWAYVQSMPETGTAIVALGKRDAAFDAGLPMAALHFRPGDTAPQPVPEHWTVTKMMDQHAFMVTRADDDLRVGDMIGFDISHPCLTFDKWRALPVLDSEYRVIDVVQTYF